MIIQGEKEETKQLRQEFAKEKKAFMKELSQDKEALRKAGMSEEDIRDMEEGYVPDGYQVHHKMPLDDSGTNSAENLVLIKSDPYHYAITNYQKEQTKGMGAGEEKEMMWPMPQGKIYPSKR